MSEMLLGEQRYSACIDFCSIASQRFTGKCQAESATGSRHEHD
ncbi:hypothetical protein PMI21_00514 [Pseudomonas sp. GM18]|nr:hypothetical protein PMI21_00514 [Pseudomonas sp. GM18]